MYTNPNTGPVTASTVAPILHLGTYRRNLLALIVGNSLFTAAEQLRANHAIHECICPRRLALWLKNVRRVEAEREQAHALALLAAGIERGEALVKQAAAVTYATPAQCDEVFRLACLPCILPCEKAQALAKLPTLTYAGAVAYIGRLYAKVLLRTGIQMHSDGSTQLAG